MPRLEAALPVRIERVALVAPVTVLRAMLVRVADSGTVQLDTVNQDTDVTAARHLRRIHATPSSAELSADPPDLDELVHADAVDLLAGEAQLQRVAAGASRRDHVAAVAGWCPVERRPALARRLAPVGASVVSLPTPKGVTPPTLLREGGPVRGSFGVLVRTYGTVPYADLDPTVPAGIGYAVMFGMMFGDAGHGVILLLAALALASGRLGRPAVLTRLTRLWPFIAAAGAASVLFGVLYGEFFGPTGVLPVVWLNPLTAPVRLLTTAVGVGVVLMAIAYGVGTVNRWREGGPRVAFYSATGLAGVLLFTGLITAFGGVYLRTGGLAVVGAAATCVGLFLAAAGFFAASGGGVAGAMQAGVQLFDTVVRLASNVVSFTRLAAFGLTHAALGLLVWRGTVGLARHGLFGAVAAVLFFCVGNALTFALEALIAGVQALRLEYYELFSRVFQTQGQQFRPWHVPTVSGPLATREPARPATIAEASS